MEKARLSGVQEEEIAVPSKGESGTTPGSLFLYKETNMPEELNVKDIDYHRNGISGQGFHVVVFDYKDEEGKTEEMVGITFVKDDKYTAILRRSDVNNGTIRMHRDGAAFRGDHFHDALWKAIEKWEEKKYGIVPK